MPRVSKEGGEVELEWMPLPEKRPNLGMYQKVIAEIERRPGQWARVRVFKNKESAYSARSALQKKLNQDKWDVEIREQEDGMTGLFLRYHRNGKK